MTLRTNRISELAIYRQTSQVPSFQTANNSAGISFSLTRRRATSRGGVAIRGCSTRTATNPLGGAGCAKSARPQGRLRR